MLYFIIVMFLVFRFGPTVIGFLIGLFQLLKTVIQVFIPIVWVPIRWLLTLALMAIKHIRWSEASALIKGYRLPFLPAKKAATEKPFLIPFPKELGREFKHITLSHGSKSFTLDRVFIGQNGRVVLLDLCHEEYRITGTDRDETWTSVAYGCNTFFDNPVMKLEQQASELEGFLRARKVPCNKIVHGSVFTHSSTTLDPRISRQSALFIEDVRNFLTYHLTGPAVSETDYEALVNFFKEAQDQTPAQTTDGSTDLTVEANLTPCAFKVYPEGVTLPDDYVVFDFETTGFTPKRHQIIQMAAYRYRNNELVDSFSSFVNPNQPIPKKIQSLTGISEAQTHLAPQLGDILPAFLAFLGEDVVVAHNASFDLSFLEAAIEQVQLNGIQLVYIDTLSLARKHLPEVKDHRLEALKEVLGLSAQSHTADADCYVCGSVYQHVKQRLLA